MEFIFQIGIVLLLVLLNGYFVASEFALIAVRKTRIDELASQGSQSAKTLQGALNHLDNYISATQLGITLASLALGWVGEPTIAHAIEPFISFLPREAAVITSHTFSVIIAFSIITFLHIVLESWLQSQLRFRGLKQLRLQLSDHLSSLQKYLDLLFGF